MQLRPEDWQVLSIPERIELVEEIWDSVARDAEKLPISDAQRALVQGRLDSFRRDPTRARPWSEVREDLRQTP